MAWASWRRRHRPAFNAARHALRIETNERLVVTALLGAGATLALWVLAPSELLSGWAKALAPVISYVAVFLGVYLWKLRTVEDETAERPLAYLSREESELGFSVYLMAVLSAWGRWFAAQFLANNNHQPAGDHTLLFSATSLVLDALVDGQLNARGRLPGEIEYEDISKETWRLAALNPVPHKTSLWTCKVVPRGGVDPARIRRLLSYDSIIVNSRQFEQLWPRREPKTDAARVKLLKLASKAGADPAEIKKLS